MPSDLRTVDFILRHDFDFCPLASATAPRGRVHRAAAALTTTTTTAGTTTIATATKTGAAEAAAITMSIASETTAAGGSSEVAVGGSWEWKEEEDGRVVRARVDTLWPNSAISAAVVVLNRAKTGAFSDIIEFDTGVQHEPRIGAITAGGGVNVAFVFQFTLIKLIIYVV